MYNNIIMSTEKTADIFKNKSEEEIMNWMIRYMTPEQIKSCFEGDIPEQEPIELEPESLNVDNLRKYCANKRYVIHKIEGDVVYFWYYLVKSETWQYSKAPLADFPQTMGAKAEECGEDTNITSDFQSELLKAYNDNELGAEDKFTKFNEGLNQNTVFQEVKDKYKSEQINLNWVTEQAVDNLLTAIEIQKSVKVTSGPLAKIGINFTPILIESVEGNKVNYYYLMYSKQNGLKFVEANLAIDKFKQDAMEVVSDINIEVSTPGEASGSDSKTPEEWQDDIRTEVQNIDSRDLARIKEIYKNFPLTPESQYFMNNLFASQTSFGQTIDLNKIDLSTYVKNKFGTNTARLFTAKVVSNNFGNKTIALVSR